MCQDNLNSFEATLNSDLPIETIEKFLPKGGWQTKISLAATEINDIFMELTIPLDVSVEDDVSLWEAFRSPSLSGQNIKKFLYACLNKYDIVFDDRELGKQKKHIIMGLFFKVFDVFPKAVRPAPEATDAADAGTKDAVPSEPTGGQTQKDAVPCKLTFEQMQNIYDRNKDNKELKSSDDGFDAVDPIRIYKGMPVTLNDHFWLKFPKNSVYLGCVALVNPQTEKVVAIGHIEDGIKSAEGEKAQQQAPHIVFDESEIRFEEFEYQETFDIILIPDEKAATRRGSLYVLPNFRFILTEIPESKKVLCIDFGTSNTTVGSYGMEGGISDSINLVKFMDVTENPPANREMLPTIVYVEECGHGKKPVYKFGYAAKKELIEADYNTKASVFFEIKRWINSMEEDEEIHDKNGNRDTVKRREIISAYLHYVLSIAEQQFKKSFKELHFTAPVKLKLNFLQAVQKMFPSPFQVMSAEESLDEGVAIVYHYISERIQAVANQQKEKILILDCGGGTTDLAECEYKYEDHISGRYLHIDTKFTNGDSNFGGNNITFRILQILKIKIAKQLQNQKEFDIHELVPLDEEYIFKKIDGPQDDSSTTDNLKDIYQRTKGIYNQFEVAYQEAEQYVPTRFAEAKWSGDVQSMRRNFYYLWKMAESIKIEFYKSNRVNMNFNREDAKDRKNLLGGIKEQYYLHIRRNGSGQLERVESPWKNIEITFKEINRVICPDIYALFTSLLESFDETALLGYRYKLSGQSCKIALFNDLLKEFIPGRMIRKGWQDNDKSWDSTTLKKYCIEGSIEYIRDRKRGSITPEIESPKPKLIYDVYFVQGDKETQMLEHGELKQVKPGVVMLPKNTQEANFRVRDTNGRVKKEFSYQFDRKDLILCEDTQKLQSRFNPFTSLNLRDESPQKKIFNALANVKIDDLKVGDKVKELFCLFVLPSKEGYGMRICQVCISGDDKGTFFLLSQQDPKFESYEDEALQTFFDGKR